MHHLRLQKAHRAKLKKKENKQQEFIISIQGICSETNSKEGTQITSLNVLIHHAVRTNHKKLHKRIIRSTNSPKTKTMESNQWWEVRYQVAATTTAAEINRKMVLIWVMHHFI